MNAFNDDSLFYPSSFGTKSPTLNSDGIVENGPGAAGFKARMELMTGRGRMWKWINLWQFAIRPGQANSP
jgi:hypothetical protein